MNRKKNYKDLEKYKETKRRQQQRHRKKYGAFLYKKRPWSKEEIELLFNYEGLDRDLSTKIKRSVDAIYSMRRKLKKEFAQNS